MLRAYGSVDFASAELTTINLPYAAQLNRLAVASGQPVKKGTLLAEMSADPAVAATYVQAQSAASAARDELHRIQALFQGQLATQSQLAAAQKALADADATLGELERQGALPGTRAITAPFDGVVVNVAAAQGDRLAAGATVMQLGQRGQSATAHVSLGIDPAQARLLPVGAAVHVAPLDQRGTSAVSDGRITALRQVLNAQTRMVDASATLDPGTAAAILPGTPVGADIELAPSVHWIVPRAALLEDGTGAYVYQVADGRAHRVAVVKAVESGERYGVDGPLVAQQPVVVRGNYELADGMAVGETAP
ncbi:MAG TPA: efflux RND transporter periplasmic adaptor subunit [Variovorax sp.]